MVAQHCEGREQYCRVHFRMVEMGNVYVTWILQQLNIHKEIHNKNKINTPQRWGDAGGANGVASRKTQKGLSSVMSGVCSHF